MKRPTLPRFELLKKNFSNCGINIHERKKVLIASEEKFKNVIESSFDWTDAIPFWNLRKFKYEPGKISFDSFKYKKFPVTFEIAEARNNFNFPYEHPIDGVVYCCTEMEPDLYLPLSSFHEYVYQSKMNAFVEMCSMLNAKEVRVIYAEEDGLDITSKFKGNGPSKFGKVEVDAEFSKNQKYETNADIFYSFPNSQMPLKKYEKSWLRSEPSWITLQKMRLERDVSQFTAEFSHTDEMGITSKVAKKISSFGIDIGGTYSTLKKRRFKFAVEFWPKQ